MNNRFPLYILGLLVIVALIWRIANPPPPVLPGPLGSLPTWSSSVTKGEMGPSAVNPGGTKWAGAWNDKDKKGSLSSALVVIDFEGKSSQRVDLGEGFFAAGLFWRDDNAFYVFLTDSSNPTYSTATKLVSVRVTAKTARVAPAELEGERSKMTNILAWPTYSDSLVARLPGEKVVTAVLDSKGEIVGSAAALDVPADAKFFPMVALSPDDSRYVLAVEKSAVGGLETFYLADTTTGSAKEVFTSKDVPGVPQGMWLSPKGLLIAAAELGKFTVVRYDPESGELVDVAKQKGGVDLAKDWPKAPKQMRFATFDGGYELNMATGKTKKIVTFDASDRDTVSWRGQIQDGQLYPRKDGDYTSVSYAAGSVDIRVIRSDGKREDPILKRR